MHTICAAVAAVTAAVAPATLATAQGLISDGNVGYTVNNVPSSCTSTLGTIDFTATGTDAAFQHWFYYCIDGDVGACAFNGSGGQLTQSYGGNLARLRWANADGRNLRADWVITVHSTGASAGLAISRMTVTNETGAPIRLNLYGYTDIDLCGSASFFDDLAAGSTRTSGARTDLVHTITDGGGGSCTERLEVYGCDPTVDQVSAFPAVRDLILTQNGRCPVIGPPFASVGGTFGPSDYTGAFQWRDRPLNPGESLTAIVVLAHNVSFRKCQNPAQATSYCNPTPGTNGAGVLVTTLEPVVGNAGEACIVGGLGGAGAVVNIGFGAPVCQQFLGVNVAVLPIHLSIPVGLDGAGNGCLLVPVPNDPTLCGGALNLQGLWGDPGSTATIPIAGTQGQTWVVGQ